MSCLGGEAVQISIKVSDQVVCTLQSMMLFLIFF